MKSLRIPLLLLALVALLSGCGKSSSPTSVTPGAPDPSPPAAPTSLTYTIATDGSVTLQWDQSSDPSVTGYQVFAFAPVPDRDNSYLSIGTTGVNTPYLMLPAQYTHGIQYFRVWTNNNGGHSAYSPTMQATLPSTTGGGGPVLGGGGSGRGHTN